MGVQNAVLGAHNVSKAFFGNPVLRDVSIELAAGRIHALLGENGAGKSTLINLLSGAFAPDSGEILVDGRPVAGLTPREAHDLGIAVVQQELSLAPHLSIAENIGLGAYASRGGLVDYGRLAAAVAEIGEELGLVEFAGHAGQGDCPSGADRSSRSPRRSMSSRAFSSSMSQRLRSPPLT